MTSHFDPKYTFYALKLLTWTFGTWPFNTDDWFSVMRFIFFVFNEMCVVILMTVEVVLNISDFNGNMDKYLLSICATLGIVKCICFRKHRHALGENVSSMLRDLLEITDERTKQILLNFVFLGRKMYLMFLSLAFGGCLTFIVPGVLSSFVPLKVIKTQNGTQEEIIRLFTLPVTMALESSSMSSGTYSITCIWLALLLFSFCLGNIGSDTYYFTLTIYLCGQFETLKEQLTSFQDVAVKHRLSTHETGISKNYDGEIERKMKMLIKRHCHLLKLATHLKEAANIVLLIQLFLTGSLICVAGFQMILAIQDHDIFITSKTTATITMITMQIYIYCFLGDYLTCQMYEIGTSAYNCQWTGLPTNLSSDVLYIILRAYKPFHLTAGGIFPINMTSFMSLLKTSFSYLNFLRVMLFE